MQETECNKDGLTMLQPDDVPFYLFPSQHYSSILFKKKMQKTSRCLPEALTHTNNALQP